MPAKPQSRPPNPARSRHYRPRPRWRRRGFRWCGRPDIRDREVSSPRSFCSITTFQEWQVQDEEACMTATIRGYQTADLDAIYRICLLVGENGNDATPLYREHRILGDLY